MSETHEAAQGDNTELLAMTADIVAAYASHNQMAQAELSELISSVHGTLQGIASGGGAVAAAEAEVEAPLVPAVPIDQSVTEDAIICLEDGKAFKTLKRHLRTAYDMSPEEYREKWGLSKSYPMIAPSYSARRAETAKRIGLGRKPAEATKATKKKK
jgi:predicted transcriptional regulator